MLLIAGSMAARGGTITGSAHDFSAQLWSGGRICVACHTPHRADTTVMEAPLWNHALSTQSYTLYGSPTMDATVGQPGGGSKLCLSCHDGTVAVNSFGGVTNGTVPISTANNLGTNLKASHPIGFTYDSALAATDGSLFDPASKMTTIGSGAQTRTGTVASVLLYGGKLECDSCHDVHNTFTVGAAGSGLVKVDQSGSKVCFACHNK
jgi:predicted CXXCH cytochrome family protein